MVPFDNVIDKDSELYRLYNTNLYEMMERAGVQEYNCWAEGGVVEWKKRKSETIEEAKARRRAWAVKTKKRCIQTQL